MMTVATTRFGAFWTILASAPTDRPTSPIGEAPKLVYLYDGPENLTRYDSRDSSLSSIYTPTKSASLDCCTDSDISAKQQLLKPRKQRLRSMISRLKPIRAKSSYQPKSRPHESLAHHCTLCTKEIPPTHFYASRPKNIQQDDTYISTRCCHNSVHSPCYRITLQYFIDSKGRPRCPICRQYPDLFIACWALGYMFDKDIGDMDDDECDCGDHMDLVCEVCRGRKQLLRDLQNMHSGIDMEGDMDYGTEGFMEKGVRLFTIAEGEEDEL